MTLHGLTEAPTDVLPMTEARRCLPEMARRFAECGAAAEPVYFGAHQKPTAVMLSYERYLEILEVLDDLVAALEVRQRNRDDDGTRLTLEELAREHGLDPADLGVAG